MNSFIHTLKTKIIGADKDFSELIQVSSVAFIIKLLSAGVSFVLMFTWQEYLVLREPVYMS